MKSSLLFCLLLCACGDNESEDAMPDPWHMWGNSKTLKVQHAVALIEESTTQLTKVQYGRPESWSFLFAARIIEIEEPSDAGSLVVNFDVTVGVGRDHVTIPGFERYVFVWTPPPNPVVPLFKWSTTVNTPVRNDSAVTADPGTTDFVVAQEINVQCRLSYTGGAVPIKSVTVEVWNMWSPLSHLRPEWYLGQFPGNEINGT